MSYEPNYDVFDFTVDEGKYRFVSRMTGAGGIPPYATRAKEAYRNGEHWTVGVNWLMTEKHSKAFTAIMMELDTTKRALRILRDVHGLSYCAYGLSEARRDVIERAMREAGNDTP